VSVLLRQHQFARLNICEIRRVKIGNFGKIGNLDIFIFGDRAEESLVVPTNDRSVGLVLRRYAAASV